MNVEKVNNQFIFFPLTARSGQRNPFSLLHPPSHIANKIELIVEAWEVAAAAGVVAYQEIKKRKAYDFSEYELGKIQEMVALNWDLIYHYALFRLTDEKDAEDIASETFLRATSSFKRFIPLEGLENPYSPWLYRIAANQISNFRRDKKRHNVFTESELAKEEAHRSSDSTLLIDQNPSLEETLIAKQRLESLQAALDKLPYRYQLVLYLKSETNMSNQKIGEALGTTEEAVKSSVHRARKALEKIYND